jgi:hypothetical protein
LTELDPNARLTERELSKHYCVKDLRFHTIVSSYGLKNADGILGISPKKYGRHSLLIELKIAGLIEKT